MNPQLRSHENHRSRTTGVDTDAHRVKKSGESVFGDKQHTLVGDNGLVMAVEATAINQHDNRKKINYWAVAMQQREWLEGLWNKSKSLDLPVKFTPVSFSLKF